MQCSDFESRLDAYLDTDLSEAEALAMNFHVQGCPRCQRSLATAQRLMNALRVAPVPPSRPGFEERVMGAVRRQQAARERRWFDKRVGLALAASFLAGVLVTQLSLEGTPQGAPTLAEVFVNVHQVQPVRLAFDTPRSFDDVDVTIELPDHVELRGYPNQRVIRWHTRLEQGKNVLTLPLIAREAGDGVITARLTSGDKSKRFTVLMRARGDVHSHLTNNKTLI